MEYKSCKMYELEAEKIINGLRIADCMNLSGIHVDTGKNEDSSVPYNLKELSVSDVLTCSYCNVTFVDASEQRNHYKLDWHRYNLKRALYGNKSVPEEVFDTLAGDVSSISGSDSESSEESDTDVSEPVKKVSSGDVKHTHKTIRHSKAFFENHENKILSVYKCLLHSKKETPAQDELLRNVCRLMSNPKKWMIIMLGGGHFAAGIFSDGTVLNHKTFHCYTVRAKQGGSQSARDNKGGSHPKSAGASLRRYNEQALIQHVQDITASWSEAIKQCSLILYRATGPYNRSVLFGGKNPIFSKTDQRLRNIPFPTRRATFKEVQRVYDMLSSIEIYGSADDFKDKFPHSPDKRATSKSRKDGADGEEQENNKEEKRIERKSTSPRRPSRDKERSPPQREIPGENIVSGSESETDEESDYELESSEITVSFQDLVEYDDTVPQFIKHLKNTQRVKRKKKKLTSKQKAKLEKKKWTEEFERIQGNLVNSCNKRDKELLMENLDVYATLPERESIENSENKKPGCVFTKEDFIDCLNAPTNEDNKDTLLHLAAQQGLPEFITLLLSAGADPTVRNRNKLTPYVVADKETRNSFRAFACSFPDKYDLKKANIPEPLTEEQEKELEEKKKERKRQKRIKEKIKKQEDKEKRSEEREKEKFLALSDREKCALAAERRILASSTANLKSAPPPVLSRCFQCGLNITGKVPFEYGNNRFCTIPCLKAHRLKTKSYGVEI